MQFDNRLSLLVDRILFRSDLVLYRYRGMWILVDHTGGDANGVRACLTSRMYRQFLSMVELPPRPTVLDIGANGGGFGLLLASCGLTPSFLGCAEMNPSVHVRLQYNLRRNLDGELYLANVAIAGRSGSVTQKFGCGDTGERLRLAAEDAVESSPPESLDRQTVEIWTFDKFVDEALSANASIDMCKIDIEGAEFEMLRGRDCQALSRCRYVIIEIHSSQEELRDEMLQLLAQRGLTMMARDSVDPIYLLQNVG